MWFFKSKKEKERIKRKDYEDIVGVCACGTNGYARYCAFCSTQNNCIRTFSYWSLYETHKCCPSCAYINWPFGELMAATKSGMRPRYDNVIKWLRESKK